MVMADATGSVQFSIGRVIGDSIGVYARNFVSFSVLALVIGVLNLVVAMYALSQTPQDSPVPFSFDPSQAGITILVTMLANALTQAAIIYGTFQDLRGDKAG